MRNELLAYVSAFVFTLILVNYNVNASDKEFVWSDSGELFIIENSRGTDITFDENGATEIKIIPAEKGEKTFVYGNNGELTIIENTSLGVFSY